MVSAHLLTVTIRIFVLINSANGANVAPSESLFNYLEGDVDKDRFITQLTLIPDMMKIAFVHSPIKKVTSLRTIGDAMNKSKIYKGMLSEIDKSFENVLHFSCCNITSIV